MQYQQCDYSLVSIKLFLIGRFWLFCIHNSFYSRPSQPVNMLVCGFAAILRVTFLAFKKQEGWKWAVLNHSLHFRSSDPCAVGGRPAASQLCSVSSLTLYPPGCRPNPQPRKKRRHCTQQHLSTLPLQLPRRCTCLNKHRAARQHTRIHT